MSTDHPDSATPRWWTYWEKFGSVFMTGGFATASVAALALSDKPSLIAANDWFHAGLGLFAFGFLIACIGLTAQLLRDARRGWHRRHPEPKHPIRRAWMWALAQLRRLWGQPKRPWRWVSSGANPAPEAVLNPELDPTPPPDSSELEQAIATVSGGLSEALEVATGPTPTPPVKPRHEVAGEQRWANRVAATNSKSPPDPPADPPVDITQPAQEEDDEWEWVTNAQYLAEINRDVFESISKIPTYQKMLQSVAEANRNISNAWLATHVRRKKRKPPELPPANDEPLK